MKSAYALFGSEIACSFLMRSVFQDFRYAIRQLRRARGFTATAIVVLGLGVCASTAIFAIVDAALIQPLPYRDPSRLVGVYEREVNFERSNLSYLDYLDWKKQNRVLPR